MEACDGNDGGGSIAIHDGERPKIIANVVASQINLECQDPKVIERARKC